MPVSLSAATAEPKREHLDSYSLDDYVRDVAEVAARLPAPPILIGHSMGGMVRAEIPSSNTTRRPPC